MKDGYVFTLTSSIYTITETYATIFGTFHTYIIIISIYF